MNDTNVIPMIGGAVIDGNRVLVAKCGQDRNLPGHWEFPYREKRPGETHEETLIRVFDEKFGTTIRVGRHLGKLVIGRVHLHVYVCEVVPRTWPVALEHEELRWVKSHEFYGLDWVPAFIEFLPAVRAIIREL
jgi:8-oxo-dGTP diphosphatase